MVTEDDNSKQSCEEMTDSKAACRLHVLLAKKANIGIDKNDWRLQGQETYLKGYLSMENNLTKDSMMECPRHGLQRPTFICRHLQHGKGLGFNQPEEPRDPECPFKNAWCDRCDQILQKEGEWNNKSESFAGIMAICESCFEEIRKRNESPYSK